MKLEEAVEGWERKKEKDRRGEIQEDFENEQVSSIYRCVVNCCILNSMSIVVTRLSDLFIVHTNLNMAVALDKV